MNYGKNLIINVSCAEQEILLVLNTYFFCRPNIHSSSYAAHNNGSIDKAWLKWWTALFLLSVYLKREKSQYPSKWQTKGGPLIKQDLIAQKLHQGTKATRIYARKDSVVKMHRDIVWKLDGTDKWE